MPYPLAEPQVISTYVTEHPDSLLLAALGTLAAVGPFTILVAVLAARLRLLGIVRGGSSLAQTAGAAAAGMITLSALGMWVLTQPGIADDTALQQALLASVFVTGGPGFALFLALTITALIGPARRTGILRPVGIVSGYLLILTSAVTIVGLAWSPALALLPVARYGALAWLTYPDSRYPPHEPTSGRRRSRHRWRGSPSFDHRGRVTLAASRWTPPRLAHCEDGAVLGEVVERGCRVRRRSGAVRRRRRPRGQRRSRGREPARSSGVSFQPSLTPATGSLLDPVSPVLASDGSLERR
jgi:hypothetical protein